MAKSLISNPPYNLKWTAPPFAIMQTRFNEYGVAPNSNANYAFIASALSMVDDKVAMILPNGVLTTNGEESAVRNSMIEANVIEAVILLPNSMFESTSISTCIIVFNKHKETQKIEFVDLRQRYVEEVRDQKGQFGGTSHTNRTYHKTVNVIPDDVMQEVIDAIKEQKDITEFCRAASLDEVRKNEYILTPSRYIEFQGREETHRNFEDIARDYNWIVKQKNMVKLTVNESLAKSLGLYETFLMMQNQPDVSKSFEIVGQKVEKETFMTISKNAAEFKIENRNKDYLPEILILFLHTWKQHIMYLNNEENRILAEFRDALLPELMSGKIDLSTDSTNGEQNDSRRTNQRKQ